jgi:hypothetical protein
MFTYVLGFAGAECSALGRTRWTLACPAVVQCAGLHVAVNLYLEQEHEL